jgi:hypothetical protein
VLAFIQAEHKTARTPTGKGEHEARSTPARLVRLDGFTEADIEAAMTWLFTADHRDALFWRQQIAAIVPLRNKGRSGLTKFASIHEQWGRATSNGKPKGADWVDDDHHYAPDMTDAEIVAMERKLAEEEAARQVGATA